MTWMITWILFAAVLSACGKEADDKKLIPKPEKKQEADAETEANAEAEAETTAETTADVSQDENWDDFCGDWTLVGFEYSDSVDDIEPSVDNPYYDAENEWIVSDILICGLQPHWIRKRTPLLRTGAMAGDGTGACNDLYLSAERLKGNGAEKRISVCG